MASQAGSKKRDPHSESKRGSLVLFTEKSFMQFIIQAIKIWSTPELCFRCRNLELKIDKFIIQDHSSDRSQQACRSHFGSGQIQKSIGSELGSVPGSIGKVFEEAFNNSCLPGREWKEIILE
jgi:hypothetical protein